MEIKVKEKDREIQEMREYMEMHERSRAGLLEMVI